MVDHKITLTSESEEMYLVSIASLLEAGIQAPVPVSQLAEKLGIQPVSANQMIRKLEESGMLVYTPYKGVELSEAGHAFAWKILRRRRLWEVFLIENLKLPPTEAVDLACRLEHAISAEATEQLSSFLGHPAMTPTGELIPDCEDTQVSEVSLDLLHLPVGAAAEVSSIVLDHPAREFLKLQGIHTGANLQVVAIGHSGDVLIGMEAGRHVHLAEELARGIRVKSIEAEG